MSRVNRVDPLTYLRLVPAGCWIQVVQARLGWIDQGVLGLGESVALNHRLTDQACPGSGGLALIGLERSASGCRSV